MAIKGHLTLASSVLLTSVALQVGNVFSQITNTNTTQAPAASADSGADAQPSVNLYRAHGWLLWLAFGVLYPIGAILAKYGQNVFKPWFNLHRAIQTVATFAATAGIAIGLKFFDALEDSTHAKLGLGLGILVWLQTLIALVRPHKGKKMRGPWYLKHWLFGTAAVILGWFNIFKGLDLYVEDWSDVDGNLKGLYIAFSVQIAIVAFMYLLMERWSHYLSQTQAPEIKTADLHMNNQYAPVKQGSHGNANSFNVLIN